VWREIFNVFFLDIEIKVIAWVFYSPNDFPFNVPTLCFDGWLRTTKLLT